MEEEPRGLQFFQRRLRRAQAARATSPDAAAFAQSVELLRAAHSLLPLARDGTPGLPPSADQEGRAQLAGLLLAAADFVGCRPCRPAGDVNLLDPLFMYQLFELQEARQRDGSRKLALGPAGQLLPAGVALPTLAELQAVCWFGVAYWGCSLLGSQFDPAFMARHGMKAEQLGEERVGEVRRETAAAAAALQRLLPHSPKALELAGYAEISLHMEAADASQALPHHHRAVQHYLRASRLACQQGSSYWTALCGARAVLNLPALLVFGDALAVPVPLVEEAAEAGRAAVEAAPRVRRVVPHEWARLAEDVVQDAQSCLPALEQVLASLHTLKAPAASMADKAAAGERMVRSLTGISQVVARIYRTSSNATAVCSGCGQHALGLRACSACSAAMYCSRECQVKDRRRHKPACRAAASAAATASAR
ncbi:hypothetical protein ABPG75_009020 [Micractinium tetrahymenae]